MCLDFELSEEHPLVFTESDAGSNAFAVKSGGHFVRRYQTMPSKAA